MFICAAKTSKMDKKIRFTGIIKQAGQANAAFVEFPLDVWEVFGKKGQIKIKAFIDENASYRGSLVKMKTECHILGLTQEIRKKISKTFGDEVSVEIWEDLEERVVDVPEDVQLIFEKNQEAKALYDKMSYTHRKEYMRWISEAKKPETRERRKIKLIEMILAGKKGI